ncbi:hypothetical protein EJP77_02250 [Paenibacillus zeisoli]|uniref:Uncharacterized protein n=1 Tax=Paenibacillus zeisoli TaxID=2496267 RepID=A0A3S1B965_9BACL|nr:hypothetical protein [Paenibacillus zeisoli]RUT35850.1 hypothetical protein EJP77_02250 [Paenibacillus zeisoli]
MKDFRGIFTICLVIFLIIGGFLVYDFTKKPPEPSNYSIRSLTHSENIEELGTFSSNLINVSSPSLYGYLIKSENDEPYLMVVERSYGKDKDVNGYYFKMSKMKEMSQEEKDSLNNLLIYYDGKSILGKNEVILTEKDTSTVKTFYKIDMGDFILWSSGSNDYIKANYKQYDFLRTF